MPIQVELGCPKCKSKTKSIFFEVWVTDNKRTDGAELLQQQCFCPISISEMRDLRRAAARIVRADLQETTV